MLVARVAPPRSPSSNLWKRLIICVVPPAVEMRKWRHKGRSLRGVARGRHVPLERRPVGEARVRSVPSLEPGGERIGSMPAVESGKEVIFRLGRREVCSAVRRYPRQPTTSRGTAVNQPCHVMRHTPVHARQAPPRRGGGRLHASTVYDAVAGVAQSRACAARRRRQ